MEPEKRIAMINEIGRFYHEKEYWLEFHARLEMCFDENLISSDSVKKEVFFGAIPKITIKTINNLVRPQNIRDVTYEVIVAKLDTYFFPKPNRQYFLKQFELRKQRRKETFFNYVSALRKLLVKCTGQRGKLRSQLLVGCRVELKKKFNPHAMSLAQVLEIGILWDQLRYPHPLSYGPKKNKTPKCFRCKLVIQDIHKGEPCPFEWTVCSGCGVKGHIVAACKYKEKSCYTCQKIGHIEKLCGNQKTHKASVPQM